MSGTMAMPGPAIRLEGEDRPGRRMSSRQPSRRMAVGAAPDATSCPVSRPAIDADACAPILAPAATSTSTSALTPALASRAAKIADEVEEILDSRVRGSPGYRQLEYLIQLRGPYIEYWDDARIMIGHGAVSHFTPGIRGNPDHY